jgi:hypothetical protein
VDVVAAPTGLMRLAKVRSRLAVGGGCELLRPEGDPCSILAERSSGPCARSGRERARHVASSDRRAELRYKLPIGGARIEQRVTASPNVRKMDSTVMKPSHIFPVFVLSFGLPHCEAPEQASPPSTPASVPPAAPGVATAPADMTSTAADPSDNASPEYVLGADSDSYADTDPAAVKDFRSTLQPYGAWTDDPTYGTVWYPSREAVGDEFSPYVTSGHWVYDDDWVWVSDYSWGWAPFHYGRWIWIEGRGWAWVPGRAYSGAWVAWGVDDGYGYVGWAPLGPQFFWFGGVAIVRPVGYPMRWVYCPRAAVFSPMVRTQILVGPAAARVAVTVRPMPLLGEGHRPAGPPPQRLGYSPSQIPRSGGSGAAGVARAQQFAHPSTAQALGGSPPVKPQPSSATGLRSSGQPALSTPTRSTTARTPPPGTEAKMPAAQPHPSPPEASRPGSQTKAPPAPAPGPKAEPPSHFTRGHGRK